MRNCFRNVAQECESAQKKMLMFIKILMTTYSILPEIVEINCLRKTVRIYQNLYDAQKQQGTMVHSTPLQGLSMIKYD